MARTEHTTCQMIRQDDTRQRLHKHTHVNTRKHTHTFFPDCATWSSGGGICTSLLPGLTPGTSLGPSPVGGGGGKSSLHPTELQFIPCGGSNWADPLILNGLAGALFYCQELLGIWHVHLFSHKHFFFFFFCENCKC